MEYFSNVHSYEELKSRFRALARENHPDAGGDPEIMKAINAEYDRVFQIWKDRHDQEASEPTYETAESTRSEFYTQNGWKGSKNDRMRSTKEVTALVRAWIRKTYPTYKFSVRFDQASMCSEIYVTLKEAPHAIYKTWEELTHDDILDMWNTAYRCGWVTSRTLDEQTTEQLREVYNKGDRLLVKTEEADVMFRTIDAEVDSYNFHDCDGMSDYFDVDFYYFGVKVDSEFKIVPKAPRLRKKASEMRASENANQDPGDVVKEIPESEKYEVQEDVHTKTGEKIYVVKIVRTLSREEYLEEKEKMAAIGGYYSKFKHGFIFHDDPRGKLVA